MSNNDNTPRFTVWKEYSNLFNDHRYILYDGGVYCKGFQDQDEAVKYAQMLTEHDPIETVVKRFNNYKIMKSWSYVFDAYRFILYEFKSSLCVNYENFIGSYETIDEAIERATDELYHPELSENKGAPEAEQIFPKQ